MSAAITENTFMTEVCGIFQENGFEGVSRCVEILVNEAMRIERSQVLCANPYERTEARLVMQTDLKAKPSSHELAL